MKLSLSASGLPVLQSDLISLPPKERAVLALLIQASPSFVSKDDLLWRAWPHRQASDESLARCVSRLRHLIPGLPLETAYGHGYRLKTTVLDIDPHIHVAVRAAAPVVNAYLHARQLLEHRSAPSIVLAAQTLRTLLQQHPDYAPGHALMARTIATSLAWHGDVTGLGSEEALAHLDRADALMADCPGSLACRAWLLDLGWHFAQAEPLHRAALATWPHDAQALFQYGWHFMACNEPQQAFDVLQRAHALQPYSAVLLSFLAATLARQARWSEALDHARRAAEMHPAHPLSERCHLALQIHLDPDRTWIDRARQLHAQHESKTMFAALLAYGLARSGRVDEAMQHVRHELGPGKRPTTERLFFLAALSALGLDDDAAGLVGAAYAARLASLPVQLHDPLALPVCRVPAVAGIRDELLRRRYRPEATPMQAATGGQVPAPSHPRAD